MGRCHKHRSHDKHKHEDKHKHSDKHKHCDKHEHHHKKSKSRSHSRSHSRSKSHSCKHCDEEKAAWKEVVTTLITPTNPLTAKISDQGCCAIICAIERMTTRDPNSQGAAVLTEMFITSGECAGVKGCDCRI